MEQEHLRNALYFLRAKFDTWKSAARLLRVEEASLARIARGERPVTAAIAVRFARTIGVGIDALLAGDYPEPGVCPRCAYPVPLDGQYREASPSLLRARVRRVADTLAANRTLVKRPEGT